MGLFKPAWLSENREKAMKAVEKLTEQSQLAEVVKNALHTDVRRAAVQRLTDQTVLAYAIKTLTSTDFLIQIVQRSEKPDCALLALEKLTSEDDIIKAKDKCLLRSVNEKACKMLYNIEQKKKLANIDPEQLNKKLEIEKQGGYICVKCGGENLPKVEPPASCVCEHCRQENHSFEERRCSGGMINHTTEKIEEWEQCVRCGKIQNQRSDVRFTDW
jgi:uncharacterized protein YcgL (UPF0745 family)